MSIQYSVANRLLDIGERVSAFAASHEVPTKITDCLGRCVLGAAVAVAGPELLGPMLDTDGTEVRQGITSTYPNL